MPLNEAHVGDRLVLMECKDGKAWVRAHMVEDWRCATCHAKGEEVARGVLATVGVTIVDDWQGDTRLSPDPPVHTSRYLDL
jgi:hypothetical protein